MKRPTNPSAAVGGDGVAVFINAGDDGCKALAGKVVRVGRQGEGRSRAERERVGRRMKGEEEGEGWG